MDVCSEEDCIVSIAEIWECLECGADRAGSSVLLQLAAQSHVEASELGSLASASAAACSAMRMSTGRLRSNPLCSLRTLAEVSRRLATSLAERSISAVAEAAGIARGTLFDIRGGKTWPDLIMIVALESQSDLELMSRWSIG